MKKVLKIIGICLGLIVIVIAIFLINVGVSDIPSYEIERPEYHVISTPQSVERGRKLSMMLCASCHMDKSTGKLVGKRMLDVPPEFGVIYSQNITQDEKFGIGTWTDSDILVLLRTGIKKDGQYSPPYMAKLPTMADEDINAIISFLRSDDSMVAADPTPDTPCEPSFLGKFLSHVAFKPLPMPENEIELPDPSDKIALGKYLAHNLDCYTCHSADFKTNNYLEPTLSEGYFGGGNKPLDENGTVKLTPNLTPDKEKGIGNWTFEEFRDAVKYGKLKDQPSLVYPMLPYPLLTDEEAHAIFKYLQTIPPIRNNVERSI